MGIGGDEPVPYSLLPIPYSPIREGVMTIARDLASFVVTTTYADLPAVAIERARMVIASTIASAAMGSEIASARIIRSLARERGGTPEASIWFASGPKLPLADVARANATMSDAAASDDSDLRNIVHLGTALTSTSIAAAERTGTTGQDVLAAIVLGYEVAGRIGEAITPGYLDRGYHGSLVAVFGATVATGKVLQLTGPQLAQAIVLAAISIGSLHRAADTSHAREYFAGLAALLGVNAALVAQKGYIAEEQILETSRGFFDVYGGQEVDKVTRDLGKTWGITTDLAIKVVPGGQPYHAVAEAAADAARSGNVDPEDVATITISAPQFRQLRGPVHPTDLIGMAHSLRYFVAAAVADQDFSWVHATAEKLSDPRITGLLEKVRADETAPDGPDRFPHRRGATVTITMKDGRTHVGQARPPRASGWRGIDWADVAAKYRTLTPSAKLTSRQIEGSLEVIHGFDGVSAMSELIGLLKTPGH